MFLCAGQRGHLTLTSSRHQVTKVHIRSLWALGLRGGGLPRSHCRRLAQREPQSSHPGNGHTKHDEPDFPNAASSAVCFHDATLVVHPAGALIERISRFIQADDAGRRSLPRRRGQPRQPGVWPAGCGIVRPVDETAILRPDLSRVCHPVCPISVHPAS